MLGDGQWALSEFFFKLTCDRLHDKKVLIKLPAPKLQKITTDPLSYNNHSGNVVQENNVYCFVES